MFFFAYYFIYSYLTEKDLPTWQKVLGLVILLPTAVWTMLGMNLPIYDANSCASIEDSQISLYPYYVEVIIILATTLFVGVQFWKQKSKRKEVVLMGAGVLTLLVFFFSSTFLVNLLAEGDASLYVYNFEIYGLFGMPFLLGFLAFLVVRYRAFDIKLVGAQALVVSLVALIGAQFLFVESVAARVLIGITLVVTGAIGINLIRSVKKEVAQREQIEKQEKELEHTNVRLKDANTRLQELDKQKTEFVSFASHQLRSPLTAMKGYASLILEGDYGAISDDLKKAAQVIFDSTKTLAAVVDDYLNVSRIELGQMKYEFASIDFKNLVQDVVDQLKPNVEKAGLKLEFKVDHAGTYLMGADKEKIKQVITNIIDNSIKYTPKGGIVVDLSSSENMIKLSVKDTGVGISKEVIPKLFLKFSRASNANKTNIRGTGLGLFIAKEIVTAHGGKIWVESQGDGKGSQFYVELVKG
jgi:signal transduction histidine kinase